MDQRKVDEQCKQPGVLVLVLSPALVYTGSHEFNQKGEVKASGLAMRMCVESQAGRIKMRGLAMNSHGRGLSQTSPKKSKLGLPPAQAPKAA